MIYKEYKITVKYLNYDERVITRVISKTYTKNYLWLRDIDNHEYVIPYHGVKHIDIELVKEEDSEDILESGEMGGDVI